MGYGTKNKSMAKIKQRRRRVALFIIIALIILICYAIFHARNYEKTYQVQDFQIKEKFDKELKFYQFEITQNDQTWHFIVEHKYLNTRKLIEEILVLEEENTKCIIPKSSSLKTFPQCIQDGKLIDFHLTDSKIQEKIPEEYLLKISYPKDSYEKIDIKNLDNNTYYIWSYKGFYRINKTTKETITIFNKDIYDISNVAMVQDYLVVPDYNESYYFNKFYLIKMKDGKQSVWDFKDSLYFDGYYLGSESNSLYYVDRKNKIEWEILPKKKRMRKVGTTNKDGKVFVNGNWEKMSLTKLTNENIHFSVPSIYHYEIQDGLFVSYGNCQTKKQISNKKVKEIVAILKDKVYYLVDDSLYYYSEATGEVEVMSYFEWNFNYKNMVFIRENE